MFNNEKVNKLVRGLVEVWRVTNWKQLFAKCHFIIEQRMISFIDIFEIKKYVLEIKHFAYIGYSEP